MKQNIKHPTRKRFGQHFLIDEGVIEAILRAMAPLCTEKIIEIGPGRLALTRPLLQRLDHLTVIEIDRDLAARLRHEYYDPPLTVIQADVLTVDFTQFKQDLRIIGNLPYNISSPLLFHLLGAVKHIKDQHFMLQREVAERMVAEPGSSVYGRLSVMLQAHYYMEKLFDVSAEAFDPPPRVTSAIVRMVPLSTPYVSAKNQILFAQVVARAFSQRRKMLRRCLGDWTQYIDWEKLEIPASARAEELSVASFVRLTNALTSHLNLF